MLAQLSSTLVSLAMLASTASAQPAANRMVKRFAIMPDTLSNETVSTAPAASASSNATLALSVAGNSTAAFNNGTVFSNGSLLLPNGTVLTNTTSLLPWILPTANATANVTTATATVTATETVVATETQKEIVTEVWTVYATATPSPVVETVITTTTATTTDLTTTTVEPPKPTSVEELVQDLDEAGMMDKILPTIYLTMVPTKEADGHWDYVVYNGPDGTATASPTFTPAATPEPTPAPTTTASPSAAVTEAAVVVEQVEQAAPVPVESVTATGSDKYTVPPTITDPAVIESLLPTATPTFVYSLPGESGTIGLEEPAVVTYTPVAQASVVVASAVASAVSTGAAVGVVESPHGNDEPEGTYVSASASGSAPAPVATQWNSTHLPLGNGAPALSNGTAASNGTVGSSSVYVSASVSASGTGVVRDGSATSIFAAPSSSASAVVSVMPLASAVPSSLAASVLVQTIQMGPSSVVVALPVASKSASVEENESGVKTVVVSSGTTTATETRTSGSPVETGSVMRRVVRK